MFLKLEVLKKIVGLTALISTMRISVMWMAYSLLFTSVIGSIINSFPNRSLLKYSYGSQIKDMLPQIILTCVMGAAVYGVRFIDLNNILTIIIQVLLGVGIYIGVSAII